MHAAGQERAHERLHASQATWPERDTNPTWNILPTALNRVLTTSASSSVALPPRHMAEAVSPTRQGVLGMTLIRCLSAPAASCKRQTYNDEADLGILEARMVHNSISTCRPCRWVCRRLRGLSGPQPSWRMREDRQRLHR